MLPGLSPVGGKVIKARFDVACMSSDGGLLVLREVECHSASSRDRSDCKLLNHLRRRSAPEPRADLQSALRLGALEARGTGTVANWKRRGLHGGAAQAQSATWLESSNPLALGLSGLLLRRSPFPRLRGSLFCWRWLRGLSHVRHPLGHGPVFQLAIGRTALVLPQPISNLTNTNGGVGHVQQPPSRSRSRA